MVFAFDFNALSASNTAAGEIVEERPFIQAGYTSDDSLPQDGRARRVRGGRRIRAVPVDQEGGLRRGRRRAGPGSRRVRWISRSWSRNRRRLRAFPSAQAQVQARRTGEVQEERVDARRRRTAGGRTHPGSEPCRCPRPGSTGRGRDAMDQHRTDFGFGETERRNVEVLLPLAMAEDFGQVGDITSTATIPSHGRGAANLVARSPGVLAGLPVAERLAAEFELLEHWRAYRADGDRLEAGTIVARLAGSDAVAAGAGTDRAELPPAAQRDRDADLAVRRRRPPAPGRRSTTPARRPPAGGPWRSTRSDAAAGGITASACTTPC